MKDAMNETVGEVRDVVDLPGDMAAIKRAFHSDQEPEWVVWLTVAGALIVGLLIMYLVTGQTTSATAGATTLKYPVDLAANNRTGYAVRCSRHQQRLFVWLSH